MPDYRLRLTLTSPLATPLYSGTLFGHLCWIKRLQDGESALSAWLAEQATHPLLISDALPRDCLPRPLLVSAPRAEQAPDEDRSTFIRRLKQAKAQRQQRWIKVEDFLALRDQLTEPRLIARLSAAPGQIRSVRQAHNTLNRHTGTTPASGGLYFMPEDWFDEHGQHRDVYVRSDLPAATVQEWFAQLGEYGYGRDASLGRGQFTVTLDTADPRLFAATGNRLLSLSHGTLSANMQAPFYTLHTHYGKLGGLYANGARVPFKYPVTLTRPGMTFSPADDGPYGELLTGVHPQYPEICHHAWHLCLPYTEVAGS